MGMVLHTVFLASAALWTKFELDSELSRAPWDGYSGRPSDNFPPPPSAPGIAFYTFPLWDPPAESKAFHGWPSIHKMQILDPVALKPR